MWRRAATKAVSVLVPLVLVAGCGGNSSTRTYTVPSPSMLPTFNVGQKIQVARISGPPAVGEIVIFNPPSGELQGSPRPPGCGDRHQGPGHSQACSKPSGRKGRVLAIKRVVAGPGDRVSIVKGRVIRNGSPENDAAFHNSCQNQSAIACDFPQPIVIPAGMYYLLGDNRGESDDSRFWGPVPRAWILAKVVDQ
jgi:signal peptidase I